MQIFPDVPLPPGIWLVKWLDLVQFDHHVESAKVSVILQLLPGTLEDNCRVLSRHAVAEILGAQPTAVAGEPRGDAPTFLHRRILAAYIPCVRIGDLVVDTRIVGRLPSELRAIAVDNVEMRAVRAADPLPAPRSWQSKYPFRVLNRLEYELGRAYEPRTIGRSSPEFSLRWTESRCLVFDIEQTQYILPKSVIFRDYFGFHSSVLVALLSGPWHSAASQLISFSEYVSGIHTGVDPLTGDWNLVLRQRFSDAHAARIALLWFDQNAQRAANRIYSSMLEQGSDLSAPARLDWFIDADIPHPLTAGTFRLQVCGYALRDTSRRRFLVTGITGSTWPEPRPTIRLEFHGSNTKGEESVPADGDRPFGTGRPPVQGLEMAEATSSSKPDATDSTNLFAADALTYFESPQVLPQVKRVSQTFPRASVRSPTGASSLVSAASATYGEAAASPAAITGWSAARVHRFEMLLDALGRLEARGLIGGYEVVAPIGSEATQTLGGLACWTLLAQRSRYAGIAPRRGWTVVRDDTAATSIRRGRCVLVLRVRIRNRALIVMEIEPRPAEDGYRIYAFEYSGGAAPLEAQIRSVLEAMRTHKGRPSDASIRDNLGIRNPARVRLVVHHTDVESLPADQTERMVLREDALIRDLRSIIEPTGADDSDARPDVFQR